MIIYNQSVFLFFSRLSMMSILLTEDRKGGKDEGRKKHNRCLVG